MKFAKPAVFALLLAGMVSWAGAQSASNAAQAGSGSASAQPQLVLLDTDIGDDIDDAFALALLLRSPEVKLLGITTTYGDTQLRAWLLERYLAAVGREDVPVAMGPPSRPNNVFSQAAYARQGEKSVRAAVNARSTGVLEFMPKSGVKFMLDTIRAHPGQVTLIAIGPLVTVQAAIERDPATFKKLKRVVMMGGSVYRGYGLDANGKPKPTEPEWNIDQDLAGAQKLLAAGVPIYMMPLDSTQIPLKEADRERIFSNGSPLTDQLTLLYHQWMTASHSSTPTLFDPVAAAYAIRPELCPATPLRLEVDDKGQTKPIPGAPNVNVCLKSDEAGFLDFLLGRIAPAVH